MGTFVEGMKKNYFISAILTIALGRYSTGFPPGSSSYAADASQHAESEFKVCQGI